MEVEYVLKAERKDLTADKEGKPVSTVTIARGHTIIKVPCISVDSGPDEIIKPFDDFHKPEGDGYFRISIWETGGAESNSGKSEIVCGPKGEKLKPVRIIRKKENANGQHALFAGKAFVVVSVTQHRNNFTVSISDYEIDPNSGTVKSATIGTWEIGYVKDIKNPEVFKDIPESIKDFTDAIKSAMEKSLHYRCDDPHYYADGDKSADKKV